MAKKNLTLTIKWLDIIDAVKIDTYLKGTIDKSADDNASRLAYNEAAGDDEHHERKLARSVVKSGEKLVTEMSDMLAGTAKISSSFTSDESITIVIQVDSRFNESFSSTLARLCSAYIQNDTLYEWWVATGMTNQAQLYATLRAETLVAIRKCFNKLAPTDPEVDIIDTKGELSLEGSDATIVPDKGTGGTTGA